MARLTSSDRWSRCWTAALITVALCAAACGGTGAGDAAAQASSTTAPTVLGTIHATLDGTARTWYVVSGTSPGGSYDSGLWIGGPGSTVALVMMGYDTATPPLDTFEWDDDLPISLGDYTGSTITLSLDVAANAVPASFPVTWPGGAANASVLYAFPSTREALMMRQGQIDVTAMSMVDGLVSVTGTFSGTLARGNGDGTVAITAGSFDIRALPGDRPAP